MNAPQAPQHTPEPSDAFYLAARARQSRTWARIRRAAGNHYDARAADAEARWCEQQVRDIADAIIAGA